MLAVLILAFSALVGTAAAASTAAGTSSLNNAGPHGLSEMTYAFASATGNNGSAFGGLNANTKFYNIALGVAMFFGRFLMIIPLMGIAGSLAAKRKLAESAGTFPVDTPLFTFLLISVVLIVGALTYFPVLSLGPYVEHFLMNAGKVF
jgi:potassium-transporting ATPase potassium-binding subunit